MTKRERAALAELFQDAIRLNQLGSPDRPPRSKGFGEGYEWGIRCAMEKVGFTWSECYDLWDAVTRGPAN